MVHGFAEIGPQAIKGELWSLSSATLGKTKGTKADIVPRSAADMQQKLCKIVIS